MVWANRLQELEYWNPSGAPTGCYHEMIFTPGDLMLQAWWFGAVPNNDYTITIEAWPPSGQSGTWEIVTDHFLWYFFPVTVNGVVRNYCTMWMNTVPESVCQRICFVLKVTISSTVTGDIVFDKWTQAYEIDPAMCCVPVTGITVEQDGNFLGASCNLFVDESVVKYDSCGKKWLRISSGYDCLDNSNGDFHNFPSQVYSTNSPNQQRRFLRRCWIDGELRENPREITRVIAFNCSVQKISHIKKWQLQGRVLFPDWKKRELEDMFQSPSITIADMYSFGAWQGGSIFERATKSLQAFRLNADLAECEKRQIFGCGDLMNCKPGSIFMGLAKVPGNGSFYDDNKNPISEDYDGFVSYLKRSAGVESVEEVTIPAGAALCAFHKVLKVTGDAGSMPTMFYVDYPNVANRIYTKFLETDETTGEPKYNDLCMGRVDAFSVKQPVFGTIVITEIAVPTPSFGTIVIYDMTDRKALVQASDNWTLSPSTDCTIIQNVITLSIAASSAHYDERTSLAMEHIATIGIEARPSVALNVDSTKFPMMPGPGSFVIDIDGKIYWNGPPTSGDGSSATIEIINFKYPKI